MHIQARDAAQGQVPREGRGGGPQLVQICKFHPGSRAGRHDRRSLSATTLSFFIPAPLAFFYIFFIHCLSAHWFLLFMILLDLSRILKSSGGWTKESSIGERISKIPNYTINFSRISQHNNGSMTERTSNTY